MPQPAPQPVQPPAPQPQWQQAPQQPGPPQQPVPAQQPVPPQRVEPDWAALADRNEADGRRKRRVRIIGGAVAVVLVGGLAAGGVLLFGKKDDPAKPGGGAVASASVSGKPTPGPSNGGPSTPGPSNGGAAAGGQPDDPSKPIWEVATDPAPQDAGALFSALQVTVNGVSWNRTVVALDQPCWDGNSTTGGLGKVLGDQGCQKVLRATYVSGDSAVTVGVAVFDHKIQAETAMKNYAGQLKGLPAPGGPAFCANPGCTGTHSSLGRYAYFTVEGSAKGGNAPDAAATAASAGFAEHVKGQLLQRAKAAGSATPGSQGTPAAAATG
ncbi:Fis family transcriptional regulator [Kitasatospora sp. NPDC001309]|uniref:Fis family transcriptional regulator n=1 Tax=Kitasatospora sp. NPDC001309 TaxID=3364013 RepID=UPI0036B988E1